MKMAFKVIFVWKIMTHSLPVKQEFHHRISSREPICGLCQQQAETLEHLFGKWWGATGQSKDRQGQVILQGYFTWPVQHRATAILMTIRQFLFHLASMTIQGVIILTSSKGNLTSHYIR
jgi:hypothetical protein